MQHSTLYNESSSLMRHPPVGNLPYAPSTAHQVVSALCGITGTAFSGIGIYVVSDQTNSIPGWGLVVSGLTLAATCAANFIERRRIFRQLSIQLDVLSFEEKGSPINASPAREQKQDNALLQGIQSLAQVVLGETYKKTTSASDLLFQMRNVFPSTGKPTQSSVMTSPQTHSLNDSRFSSGTRDDSRFGVGAGSDISNLSGFGNSDVDSGSDESL